MTPTPEHWQPAPGQRRLSSMPRGWQALAQQTLARDPICTLKINAMAIHQPR